MMELRPISVLVRNERGVLSRVSGLLARRGFNITSLAVGETEDPNFSRISVVVSGDDSTLEQAVKQLKRLVCVQKVRDVSKSSKVERGLALIKVKATHENRHEIVELANIFRASIDHVDSENVIVEVTGKRDKVQALIDMLRPYGITEMARTGQIVLERDRSLESTSASSSEQDTSVAAGEQGIYNLNIS